VESLNRSDCQPCESCLALPQDGGSYRRGSDLDFLGSGRCSVTIRRRLEGNRDQGVAARHRGSHGGNDAIRRRLGQHQPETVAQREGIRRAPRDGALAIATVQ